MAVVWPTGLEPIDAGPTETQGPLEYIPDHKGRGLALWLSQFRHTTVSRAVMVGILNAVQRAEDDAFNLWLSTHLDVAQGHALEQWGELVGEERGALSDDADYRAFIRARILANNHDGNPAELQTIVERLCAPCVVNVIRQPPASDEIVIWRETYMSDERARRVGRLLRLIKPAGVSRYIVEVAAGYLGWDGDPEASPLDEGELCRTL